MADLAVTEIADASIDRLTRKMVNDCGISVFREVDPPHTLSTASPSHPAFQVVAGSKAGGNAVLVLPEVNWVLAALATVSGDSVRKQLRHMLRQELVGQSPPLLEQLHCSCRNSVML